MTWTAEASSYISLQTRFTVFGIHSVQGQPIIDYRGLATQGEFIIKVYTMMQTRFTVFGIHIVQGQPIIDYRGLATLREFIIKEFTKIWMKKVFYFENELKIEELITQQFTVENVKNFAGIISRHSPCVPICKHLDQTRHLCARAPGMLNL